MNANPLSVRQGKTDRVVRQLKQLLGTFGVACDTLCPVRSPQVRIIPGQSFWYYMIGWRECVFPDVFRYGSFINGKRECLTNMDVIEWFGKIVHGIIVDPELFFLMELGFLPDLVQLGMWYLHYIEFFLKITLIGCLCCMVEGEGDVLELWRLVVVMGIGYKCDITLMNIM